MVSHHEMRNISYITQDPEDRRVFAYIAKDAKTDKHYCHVFRMDVIVSGARSILFCFLFSSLCSFHPFTLCWYDCLFSVFINFILLAFVR